MDIAIFIEVLVITALISGFMGSLNLAVAIVAALMWAAFAFFSRFWLVSSPMLWTVVAVPIIMPFVGAAIGAAVRRRFAEADAESAAFAKRQSELEAVRRRTAQQRTWFAASLKRRTLTPEQVRRVLGRSFVDLIARRVGISPDEVVQRLAKEVRPAQVNRPISSKAAHNTGPRLPPSLSAMNAKSRIPRTVFRSSPRTGRRWNSFSMSVPDNV